MQQVPEGHLHPAGTQNFDEFSRRYEVLLNAADLAATRGFPALLKELSQLLRELLNFDLLSYAVRDDRAQAMRTYMVEESLQVAATPEELQTDDSPAYWVWSRQQPLVIPDLRVEDRFREALDPYATCGYRSLAILPMTTVSRRLGSLSLGKMQAMEYEDEILSFFEGLASLTALALENSLCSGMPTMKRAVGQEEEQLRGLAAIGMQMSLESATAYENLRREREQLETIVEIQGALAASRLDLRQMFSTISKSLHKAIPHDAGFVTLWDEKEQSFGVYAVEPEEMEARI